MDSPLKLIKAIQDGKLAEVRSLLDGGLPVELDDGQGDPGLPLAMACFAGRNDIVEELVRRGARVNRADNRQPTSPLSMAIRGGKTDTVRLLLELGADLPPGMATGLAEHDVMLAQLKAVRAGLAAARSDEESARVQAFEEIDLRGFSGVDTLVLESDILRAEKNRR